MQSEKYSLEVELGQDGGKPKKNVEDVIAIEDPDPQKAEEIKVKPYAGMGKEELLQHSGTRVWKNMRNIFIWFFFLCWVVLVCTSIALIVVFPRCKVAKKTAWWEETTVYWIYPKSFQDSDKNGRGDIKGIENRLGHLTDIGVDTFLLDTILQNGGEPSESGYDVTSFVNIDPVYGNLMAVESLINKTHEKGLHLLMTFIPNHTGTKHAWFIESAKDKTNAYRNFFIWRDCGSAGTQPPNNWLSMFDKSAWTFNANRTQCYFHQGTEFQPDLNLRNTQVQKEIEKAMTFWLEKGVDGFYIPRASYLFEDYDLRNETTNPSGNGYNSLMHNYTQNLADTHGMIKRWRRFLDDFSLQNNVSAKFLLLDGWGTTPEEAKQYYEADEAIELVNHRLQAMENTCNGKCVKGLVEGWLTGIGAQRTNWPVTSPSLSRPANRFGVNYLNALNMLSLLLPGTGLVYYGDELGMVDSAATGLSDPMDAYRSPMQWSNATNAGFTDAAVTPWLQVNSDAADINVLLEKEIVNSTLTFYKSVLALRKQAAIKQSDNMHYAVVNDNVFSFVKEWDGVARYLVAINFGIATSKDDYPAALSVIPAEATVILTTENGVSYKMEDKVETKKLELGPQQGVVLTWDYIIKEHL
ncbi:amino acid transporter heavy chain SLC3A1-like isoform X2 [Lineus longissimus]